MTGIKGIYVHTTITLLLLVVIAGFSLPFTTGQVFTAPVPLKYPYQFQWIYVQETLVKATPAQRAAFINAVHQAIAWWRSYPKIMPTYLSVALPDLVFETGEEFVIWWQSQPLTRDMVIYIVDDSLQASLVECLNAIGNSEGTIFDGDASIWIATQHIQCVNGQPYRQNWLPYAEFHDILKALLGEAVGHGGICPLGDLLGWLWECIFESVDDAENHPSEMCPLCWRWYTTTVIPLYGR
jgi:hypothetical protein